MIRLCEACWKRITRGQLDRLRLKESHEKYKPGEECAFLHVAGANAALSRFGEGAVLFDVRPEDRESS